MRTHPCARSPAGSRTARTAVRPTGGGSFRAEALTSPAGCGSRCLCALCGQTAALSARVSVCGQCAGVKAVVGQRHGALRADFFVRAYRALVAERRERFITSGSSTSGVLNGLNASRA